MDGKSGVLPQKGKEAQVNLVTSHYIKCITSMTMDTAMKFNIHPKHG